MNTSSDGSASGASPEKKPSGERLLAALDAGATDANPPDPEGIPPLSVPDQLALVEQLLRATDPARMATEPLDPQQITTWSRRLDVLARHICPPKGPPAPGSWTDAAVARLASLHAALPTDVPNRDLLLVLLASRGGKESLNALTERLTADPPRQIPWVVRVFQPLWQLDADAFSNLFPGMLDALAHPQLASIVLDLANYAAARGLLPDHPARSRAEQLVDLLGAVGHQLERFEQKAIEQTHASAEESEQAMHAIALAISLSYAVALMRLENAVGKLYRLLELRHRRLQVEVAAALVRLGEERGVEALQRLAVEPLVRQRVLSYAAELGVLDSIPAEYREEVARAQADVAARLAEPTYYGVPPGRIDLVDERRIRWPGYDEPVNVYLFEVEFTLPGRTETNVVIAGPVTHCFATDLTSLPLEDILAAFAGWQAEHEQIADRPAAPEDPAESPLWQSLERIAAEEQIDSLRPEFVGDFFGDKFLVASGRREDEPGTLIVPAKDLTQARHEARGAAMAVRWIPQGNPTRPITAEMAYTIFKGNLLLATFNPGFGTRSN